MASRFRGNARTSSGVCRRLPPAAAGGDWKEDTEVISRATLRAMYRAGHIMPSPRLTAISGMMWVRAPKGDEVIAAVEALEAEWGKTYGPVP